MSYGSIALVNIARSNQRPYWLAIDLRDILQSSIKAAALAVPIPIRLC